MDLNEPPIVEEIDEGTFCDTSSYKYNCYQPSLLGDNFIDLKTLSCKVKISKVTKLLLH